jgi:hypothetical protein
VAAQDEGRRLRGGPFQRLLDRGHRLHHRSALTVFERSKQVSDFLTRAALKFGLGGAALGRQRELVDAAVVL